MANQGFLIPIIELAFRYVSTWKRDGPRKPNFDYTLQTQTLETPPQILTLSEVVKSLPSVKTSLDCQTSPLDRAPGTLIAADFFRQTIRTESQTATTAARVLSKQFLLHKCGLSPGPRLTHVNRELNRSPTILIARIRPQ